MSVQTGADLEKDVYGGLLTEVGQSNMPSGGSPANLNVEFLPGLARTRGGLQVQGNYAGIAGGPWQVRYTKSYGQVPENQTSVALLVNPTLNTQGVVASNTAQIGNVYGYGPTQPWAPFSANPGWAGPLAKSSTQFGREYIAISEGRYGYDLPRQWDGTYYDRVSKWGPGVAPNVADGAYPASYTMVEAVQLSAAITQITEANGIATVVIPASQIANTFVQQGDEFEITGNSIYDGTWTAVANGTFNSFQFATSLTGTGTGGTIYLPITLVELGPVTPLQSSQFAVGTVAKLAGSTVSGYDGVWPIRQGQNPTPTTTGNIQIFIAITNFGLGTGTGGTVNPPSQIVAGLRQFSVCFLYQGGYITKPAPPKSWYAAGYLTANVTNIPTGPAGVIGRLLIFTPFLTPPATTGTFYSIRENPNGISTVMQINDNTTTTLNVNFSDSDLISGFNAQYLFGLRVLGPCAGTFPYASRMFYWGELNVMQDFYGTDFNGGWSLGAGTAGSDVPLGWTSDPVSGGSGARSQNGGVWDDAYTISGTGSLSGMITQPAFQNYLGTALLAGNTSYSCRMTAQTTDPGLFAMTVDLFSPTAGQLAKITWLVSSANYFTFIFTFSALTPAVIPVDTLLRIYGLGQIGQTLTIDRIEPFPTNQPITYTGAWASYASDPESIDGVTGLVQPIYSNGEAVRTIYTLRDSMYVSCDRSTFVTKDVAGSEPAFWTIDPVSSTIGCTGPAAAAAGEDWEVKVNRYGLYMYLGREPEKISQEIQSLWNKQGAASQINWQYGYKVWATVDLQNKRVYIGAPINGATECNCVFVMDYNTLDTSEMIAQYPTLRFSPYTGKRVILEQGRKWTQWTFQPPASLELPAGSNLPVPCGAFIEQSNGLATFVLGGGADSNVYFIDPTNRGNDNGQPCLSYYTTHFSPTQDEEQGAQAESGPMRGHMHLFSFLRKYVQGVGKLSVFIYENTLSSIGVNNPRLIGSVDLRNPAPTDAEMTFDTAKAERWAISWQTNTLNSWWEAQRYIPVLECDPNNLTRGSNMQ